MSKLQQKKKICCFCEKWSNGGIETYLAENISHMDRTGLELHLAVSVKETDLFDDLLKKCEVRFHLLQKNANDSSFARTAGAVKAFGRLCCEERFDLVHLNVFHGVALLLAREAQKSGIPRVAVHCHGAGLRKSSSFVVKMAGHQLCKYLLQNAPTERWAASEAAGEFLFPNHRSFEILFNGIETKRFRYDPEVRKEIRKKLGIGNRWVIGCVGRLENQKNQDFLIELLPRLPEEYLLLLVGDGEDRERLGHRSMMLGVKDRIIFTGYRKDIEKLYSAMDVLAVPSWNEGLSRTAIEGQAAGLPVVCSEGVPKEAEVGNNIYFVPLTNQDEWLQALRMHDIQNRVEKNDLVAASRYDIGRSAAVLRERYEGG